MPKVTINGKTIEEKSDCYVIAEIGHNHQGKIETAKEMFRIAKECGADAVKLQKRNNRKLYTRDLYDKPYSHQNSYGASYGEHREALEFGFVEYRELFDYAQEIGIAFFATAFDFDSADFLTKLDVPAFKVASGDLKNIPLLRHIAAYHKPMIVSTGGGTMEDVERAYDAVMPINHQLCLLQCTSGYPAAFEEMNLQVITTYRQHFPHVVVGLSSHDNGIAMPVAAYMLGARIIEKHFTLNHTWKGTDHAFSLEPTGLRKMIRDLRRLRLAVGDGIKKVYKSEREPLKKMGKKLVAARDLPAGHTIGLGDIAIKSPGDGLPPYELDNIVGRRTLYALLADEDLCFEMLSSANQLAKAAC
jgi:N-acetylneuraminate synthase/sialic acid synthase